MATITARGTGTNTTAGLSFTLAPGGNFSAGSWAVLAIAADNADTSGTAHSTFTVTDSLGNTWTRQVSALRDPGAASAGVEGAVFTTPQDGGTLTTGTTITVTFDASTTAKVWTLTEFAPGAGTRPDFVQSGTGGATSTASPTITTASITSGNVVFGFLFNEYGTAQTVTADADTTNGSWSALQTAEIGSTTSGVTIATQWKTVSATGTQTYNPTLATASDLVLGWIELDEVSTTIDAAVSESVVGTDAPTGAGVSTGTAAETVAATSADVFDWSADVTIAEAVGVVGAESFPAGGVSPVVFPARGTPKRQPQGRAVIDWRNPITRGLVFAWNAGSGLDDLVSGWRGQFGQAGARIQPAARGGGVGLEGVSLTVSRSIKWSSVPIRRLWGNKGLTFFNLSQSRTDAWGATNTPGLIVWPSATGPILGATYFMSGTDYRFYVGTGASSAVNAALSISGTGNQRWMALGGTYNGTQVHARSDKRKSGTPAALSTGLPSFTADIIVGNVFSDEPFDGWVGFAAIWDRALSDSEWNSLVDDPYQFVVPAVPVHYWFGTSGASSQNVTTSEAVAVTSAQAPTQDTTAQAAESAAVTSAQAPTQDTTGTAAESVAVTTAHAPTQDTTAHAAESAAVTTELAQDGAQTVTTAEAFAVTSAQGAAQDTTGTVAESVAAQDVAATIWSGDAAVALTLSVTAAQTSTQETGGTVAESVSTASAQAQDGAAVLTLGESIGQTDAATLVASWEALATFQAGITDAASVIATFQAVAVESVATTSAQLQDGDAISTVSESITGMSAQAVTQSAQITIAESIVAVDLKAVAATFVVAVADALAATMQSAAGSTLDGVVSEAFGTTSPVVVSVVLSGTVAFDLGAFDLAAATGDQSAAVVFNATLGEALASGLATGAGVVESLGLIDTPDGQRFQAVIGLPDGRTLVVVIDARTAVVDADSRTLAVRQEMRRIEVDAEARRVVVGPDSRSITVH